MTRLADLQSAVRQVAGVSAATVRWPEPHGPAQLRVEFQAGSDRRAVTEAIVRTMAEVGNVDLRTMEVESLGTTARLNRGVFTQLSLDRVGPRLKADVTIATSQRSHIGTAEGVEEDELLTIARATVSAANSMLGQQGMVYALRRLEKSSMGDDLERVLVALDVIDPSLPYRPGSVSVTLLGAVLVRGDAREAAVRAVLDAVNRHLSIEGPAEADLPVPGMAG